MSAVIEGHVKPEGKHPKIVLNCTYEELALRMGALVGDKVMVDITVVIDKLPPFDFY